MRVGKAVFPINVAEWGAFGGVMGTLVAIGVWGTA